MVGIIDLRDPIMLEVVYSKHRQIFSRETVSWACLSAQNNIFSIVLTAYC